MHSLVSFSRAHFYSFSSGGKWSKVGYFGFGRHGKLLVVISCWCCWFNWIYLHHWNRVTAELFLFFLVDLRSLLSPHHWSHGERAEKRSDLFTDQWSCKENYKKREEKMMMRSHLSADAWRNKGRPAKDSGHSVSGWFICFASFLLLSPASSPFFLWSSSSIESQVYLYTYTVDSCALCRANE